MRAISVYLFCYNLIFELLGVWKNIKLMLLKLIEVYFLDTI